MQRGRHVGRPVGSEHEQPRGLAPAGQAGQQVDGGRVAPVQVFQDEHEKLVGAQGVEGVEQLTEHPVTRGPLRSTLHGFEVFVHQQRRQLHEPGRRELPEDVDNAVAGRPPQSTERLQHRQIRLAGAVLFDALPARDANRPVAADPRQERLHQRGLADPRLAGDEHELPLAVRRAVQRCVEPRDFGLPPRQRHRTG